MPDSKKPPIHEDPIFRPLGDPAREQANVNPNPTENYSPPKPGPGSMPPAPRDKK